MKKPTTVPPVPDIDGIDVVFPTKALSVLPSYADIPDEFKSDRHPWAEVAEHWFFFGLKKPKWKAKGGVDVGKALAVIQMCLGDWSPSHEHKIAGVAYLLHAWFESVEYERGEQ